MWRNRVRQGKGDTLGGRALWVRMVLGEWKVTLAGGRTWQELYEGVPSTHVMGRTRKDYFGERKGSCEVTGHVSVTKVKLYGHTAVVQQKAAAVVSEHLLLFFSSLWPGPLQQYQPYCPDVCPGGVLGRQGVFNSKGEKYRYR